MVEYRTLITLPLDVWYPYNIDNIFSFYLTYCHQIISGLTLTCMHLSTDTLYVGFLLHMNYQLKILIKRLRNFGNKSCIDNNLGLKYNNELMLKTTIERLIKEHQSIYR
jgi:hypothetical protein